MLSENTALNIDLLLLNENCEMLFVNFSFHFLVAAWRLYRLHNI